jgi:hypothetical protein
MQADPRPPPEVPIFRTCTSRLLHPAAKAKAFLLKPGLSSWPGSEFTVAVRQAQTPSPYPYHFQTSRMMAPVIVFLNLTECMPTSASGIFALDVASNSAYDIFTASLSVNVTADDFGGRGAQPSYWSVPVLFLGLAHRFPVDFAAFGPGEHFILFSGCGQRAGGALHIFPPFFSVALAFFPFLCLFLLFLGSTTFHSLPSCSLESDGNREVQLFRYVWRSARNSPFPPSE